ncbi:hypothetical protein BH09MYX1_BH09MYX1_15350 [soil metagenome]
MRRSPRRRIVLALAAVGLVACYVTRVSDEDRVVDYASKQMACDPSLIHLESESASSDSIARYSAHGCGQVRTFDCTQEGEAVVCRPMRSGNNPDDGTTSSNPGGSILAGAILGSACACAHGVGGGSHTSAPASHPPSTTPSDPAR